MNKSCSMDDINNNWLVKYRNEDNPAKLLEQVKWLEEIGFSDIDIIWKYYNFAVYGGLKKRRYFITADNSSYTPLKRRIDAKL